MVLFQHGYNFLQHKYIIIHQITELRFIKIQLIYCYLQHIYNFFLCHHHKFAYTIQERKTK